MVRHWNRHLRVEKDPAARSRMLRSRVINAIGASMTGLVLVVVLVTKFTHGAGYAIAAMAVLFVLMNRIRTALRPGSRRAARRGGRHQAAAAALAGPRDRARVEDPQADPARARLRAGDATDDPRGAHRRRRPRRDQGAAGRVGPPRRSRCRSRSLDCALPRDHPAGRRLRARRSAPATRATSSSSTSPSTSSATGGSRCCTTRAPCGSRPGCSSRPGVMVTSVPWQLASSEGVEERIDGPVVGDVRARRGLTPASTAPGSRSATSSRSTSPPSPTAATASPAHEGQVLFVRHTLPGERVVARVTEGEAGEPLRAGGRRRGAHARRRTASSRPAPWPAPAAAAGATSSTSPCRAAPLKADVVREQISRLAGLDVDVEVGRCPGDVDGLRLAHPGRVRGRRRRPAGLRRHRSHDVVPIDHCLHRLRRCRLPPGHRAAVDGGRSRRCRRAAHLRGARGGGRAAPEVPVLRGASRHPGPTAPAGPAPGRASTTSRRAASGRCTPVRPRRSCPPSWDWSRRGPASARSTCMPASACSPSPWPTRWARRARCSRSSRMPVRPAVPARTWGAATNAIVFGDMNDPGKPGV